MDHVDPQGRIIKIDEALVKRELGDLVKDTVEETLNKMLDAEACQGRFRFAGFSRFEFAGFHHLLEGVAADVGRSDA